MKKKKHGHSGHKHVMHEHSGTMHMPGLGKDPRASAEHHAGNREAGMPEGMCPTGEECDGDTPEEGGKGMGSNCSYE